MNKHIIGIVAAATLSGAANAEAYDWNEARQNLTAKRQSLAAVAAFSAVGDLNGLEKAFDNALNNGLAVNELKELVLQLYAYTGFPRCLNAAATLEKVVKARQTAGKEDLTGPEPQKIPAGTDKYELGKKNLEVLVAGTLPSHPDAFIQDTDTFLKEHLFADIFARGVLTYQEREVGTVAALAALANVTPQLKAHMNLALNVGVTSKEMAGIMSVVKDSVGKKIAAYGLKAMNDVLAARAGK
ncbi:MAG: carboxymuconolactone decarboxylase family protein [Elusimicrobiaceae bacterium]|uniref:carboxymuconolactone decarboxylase family protein n=1 Tax=Candidatus Avelusimicrobium fimicolum TaxID=3416216 RepID=UPI002A867161|nr:carboxymuconolactone decarboxylase family protein [Elusimicrobiaceae bacterium]